MSHHLKLKLTKIQIKLEWWKFYEEYDWDCIALSLKFACNSMMDWGAFSSFDKSPLVIIIFDKRSIIDFVTTVYVRALIDFYFFQDDPKQLILMEGGVPIHYSSLPLSWRCAHGIEKLNWFGNSLDINPIENV